MANKILIKGQEVSGSSLLRGKISTSHAMVGETLAADQLDFEVITNDVPFIPADQDHALITKDNYLYYAKNDLDVSAIEDGEEITCYSGNTLIGKYFFDEAVQLGVNQYKITAVSIIGRLLNSKHYGGMYNQILAQNVYADILSGLTYIIDPDISSASVTGYLPIATRRDNLQQLMAATGATIQIDGNGSVHILPMSSVSTGSFSENRCYKEGKLNVGKVIHGVKLTEHNYSPAQNEVTLFNDGLYGNEVVEFKEPYHDLVIEGGTIVESGANYAKISGEGTVTITGKPYTHITRIVTAGTVEGVSTDSVSSISDFYLANPQIAQALAERFYSYLKCNKTIAQDVLTGTERAGDLVYVIDPYTKEMESATIKSYNINMSGVNKASAEFLVGFVPTGVLSGFTSHAMLTGSGSWTVPTGVTKIRIILVGAGTGGVGGENGADGSKGVYELGGTVSPGAGGSGGKAGKAGAGGKVFEISLSVSPGDVFSFACGVGGIGGTAGEAGTDGTETTFGGYSSDYGRLYPYGYYEAKTGLTFAGAGADGVDGGKGGNATDILGSYSGGVGEDGEDVETYTGGTGGYSWTNEIGADGRNYVNYGGAGGGGAARGSNGGNATKSVAGVGADAGSGADGVNPGQGGGAGNGGGGGGGGSIYYAHNAINSQYDAGGFSGASGGSGGQGGSGGAGAIIIYY